MLNDLDITMFDALLYAMEGDNPSKAIENQERRGQQDVVRNQRLPRKEPDGLLNSHDAKAQYEKMGIEVIGEHDDLFYNVKLPAGWQIKATGHSMWNELRDDKGRLRAEFFYKAAFYDRDAFIHFRCRYKVKVEHIAPDDADWDTWEASDFQGVILDGEKVIRETELVPAPEKKNGRRLFDEEDSIKRRLRRQLEDYMQKNYPEYKDVNAYWN